MRQLRPPARRGRLVLSAVSLSQAARAGPQPRHLPGLQSFRPALRAPRQLSHQSMGPRPGVRLLRQAGTLARSGGGRAQPAAAILARKDNGAGGARNCGNDHQSDARIRRGTRLLPAKTLCPSAASEPARRRAVPRCPRSRDIRTRGTAGRRPGSPSIPCGQILPRARPPRTHR